MLPWSEIDSVFLDMDGTLLDLHFDNHFWQEHVPKRYAEQHQLPLEQAKQQLYPRFQAIEGSMQWYCVDFWSQELKLDIAQLKAEISHLIALRPAVMAVLAELQESSKRIVLVTNAHSKSIDLKLDKIPLTPHLERIVCAHDLGIPKEHPQFWLQLQTIEPFDPAKTLLIDDSLSVLRSAQAFGIRHLLCVDNPDSQRPPRNITEFPTLHHFQQLLPIIPPPLPV